MTRSIIGISEEIYFLFIDIKRLTQGNFFLYLNLFFQPAFWAILSYRFERVCYYLFGIYYRFVRVVFLPLLFLMRIVHKTEIHYLAKIGSGFIVLHPSLGLVISGKAKIGARATFNGGNVIGSNYKNKNVNQGINIGDNLEMGVNSVIVGPICISSNTVIGANAVVTKSVDRSGLTLVGNPAIALNLEKR